MSLLKKTYWQWNDQYNVEPFSLGKEYSVELLQEAYDLIETQGDKMTFKAKANQDHRLVLQDGLVVQKSYFGAGKIEGLLIERAFYNVVEARLETYLTRCQESDHGPQLMAGYLDGILGALFLNLIQ